MIIVVRYQSLAVVAQLVERDLAKVEVAGSCPVCRSKDSSRGYVQYELTFDHAVLRCLPLGSLASEYKIVASP